MKCVLGDHAVLNAPEISTVKIGGQVSSAIRACIARTAIHVKPILTLYTVAPHTAGSKISSLSEAIATHLGVVTQVY